ncbi:uncharacterized protein LOC128884492 [Hylaeus volcanicus]|uniref:uncharacterized protein LOC128884492 n=1 Tax=Hylaeus volcanicus TaxID=313075 RepID=UPI0023B7B1D0|nr:uncharacterized protein LOC128884492 [Hylaeus volcanicus]
MQASSYAELLQQLPVDSNLFEWKFYDPPRQFLLVTQVERQEWSPSLWTSNIAPRWKSVLCDFILNTKSSNVWDRLINEALDNAIDKLVVAFIEFLNAILFFRITSHQALEFLRDVFDQCNKHLNGSNKTNSLSGDGCSSDLWYPSESRKNESATKSLTKPLGKIANNFSSTTSKQSDPHVLLMNTQIHISFLEALRWSMEYATELSDQLTRSLIPSLETSKNTQSLSTTSSHSRSSIQSKAFDFSRYQQRIFHVLDVVEKSGILSLVEIIANIPCSQLDHVGFCKTRDQLPLMKFYVRLRTKDVFTLPVYNLESENTLGYSKLHVCLQAFISNSYDHHSCGCWKSTVIEKLQDDSSHPNTKCLVARGLVVHLEKTIVNFQLCVNRVVMIVLLYTAHYLCVVRHSLLDVLLELVPKEKIIFCFKFLLSQTEKNMSSGHLSSRDNNAV